MSAHDGGWQRAVGVDRLDGASSRTAGPGPVVVGGLGGSGTRVVADLVRRGGADIGPDLNDALDNLWFTLLFKRPAWLRAAEEAGSAGAAVARHLEIFESAMRGGRPFDEDDLALIEEAVAQVGEHGHDHRGSGKGEWAIERRTTLLARRSACGDRWGWKEPNSHMFLHHLATRWADLRFVLVVRDGLDMAFSGNVAQLHNWGAWFGIERGGTPLPQRQLRYWLAANRRAVEVGRRLLGDRFVVVSYDALCRRPADHGPRLLAELDLDDAGADLDLRPSSSVGRHHHYDLSVLHPDDVEAARAFLDEVGGS